MTWPVPTRRLVDNSRTLREIWPHSVFLCGILSVGYFSSFHDAHTWLSNLTWIKSPFSRGLLLNFSAERRSFRLKPQPSLPVVILGFFEYFHFLSFTSVHSRGCLSCSRRRKTTTTTNRQTNRQTDKQMTTCVEHANYCIHLYNDTEYVNATYAIALLSIY